MNTAKKLVVVSIALALGMSSAANAATQKEDDSAYQWGRWAVLSPAAGGSEPYAAGTSPVAQNSPRPETALEYNPEILDNDTTPVVVESFCTAGANCGYATYYKGFDEEGIEDDRFQPADVVDDLEEPDNNYGSGPVLARFNLETFPLYDGEGRYEIEGVADYEEEGEEIRGARFKVYDTGDKNFPDIKSVEMDNEYGGNDFYGEGVPQVEEEVLFSDGSFDRTTTTQVSGIEELDDLDGVATGQWSDGEEIVKQFVSLDPESSGVEFPQRFDFFRSGGFFVFGTTATLDAMEQYKAGNVQATYRGVVLDYNSAVTLNFDFGADTFRGVFDTHDHFSGFEIDGNVRGINFSARDGERSVLGSFFNGGSNASGSVNNGTQLGVFSADHIPH